MTNHILPISIAIFFIGIIIWFFVLLFQAGAKRQEWLNVHCEIIAKTSDSYGVGNTFTNGKVGVGTIYIPGKITYKCDDGIIYTE